MLNIGDIVIIKPENELSYSYLKYGMIGSIIKIGVTVCVVLWSPTFTSRDLHIHSCYTKDLEKYN